MHTTAGLFGGDNIECSIHLEKGARVRMTQQCATKVHPSEGRFATPRMDVFVDCGAELALHLEPVIPFAASRLKQETRLHVALGGTLSYWEGFMTGRIGHGESWKFDELSSETRLCYDNRVKYIDRFLLTPGERSRSGWGMAGRDYTGIGLYVGNGAQQLAARFHAFGPGCGVDLLEENISLTRVVSRDGPEFHRFRDMFCRPVNRPL
jgi:urease accessory protein